MKTYVVMVIVCAILIVGSAIADPGIPKVNEVQGLSTSTTVIAAGNFNSASNVDMLLSTGVPLTAIPGPTWSHGTIGGTIYQSLYTEDSQNSEVGYISYDKDLDVSTANKVSGQYNIQAVKQITYLGVDASSMITNDYLLLDGAGWPGNAGTKMICPFTGNLAYGAFCNRVETGSTMNLKVANLNTQMGDRFVMKAADSGVEVFNNVGVGSYAENLTSKGSVSAYIRGSIKEAGRGIDETPNQVLNNPFGVVGALYETATFSDTTAISGDISSFAKQMSYKSVIDTSGDIPLVS
jgi:hypothetical protein